MIRSRGWPQQPVEYTVMACSSSPMMVAKEHTGARARTYEDAHQLELEVHVVRTRPASVRARKV
jgi:hypothetical protein